MAAGPDGSLHGRETLAMSRRTWRPLAAVLLTLLAPAVPASAQRGGFVGAGSTPQGDILRGAGIYYDGLGRYNLNSAIGRSIDTDTMIRWNEYVYSSLKQMNREAAERLARERYRNKVNYEAIRQRIRDNPTRIDLMSGDALNFLLEEFSDPKVDPSAMRLSNVPLPGPTIRMIPFQYGQLGGVISMRILTVRDGWPLPLRGDDFALEREAYGKAVDVVLEQDLKNKLTLEAVKAVQQAVQRIKDKAMRTVPETDRISYAQVQSFLKDLAKEAELLQTPLVGDVLAGIEKYPGTTVADLLAFMQRYNLRFSPAGSPAERELYQNLYPALIRQRRAMGMAMGGKANGGGAVEPEDPPKQ
jgi:hypothetical protein